MDERMTLERLVHEYRPTMDSEVLHSWAADMAAAVTAHLTQPAQSVAIYPVGHFIETSAGEFGQVSRQHERDGDVFQLYRAIGNAQAEGFAGFHIVENADVPDGEIWIYDKSKITTQATPNAHE